MLNITYLYYLSVQIEANIYGSVENTAKLNNIDLVVIKNSRQLWTIRNLSHILESNTVCHGSEASGAALTCEHPHSPVHSSSQQDLKI
jgi:hypothetical protein